MDAILFDLDDTLCRYRRHGREVLAGAFERLGVDPCFDIQDYYAVYEAYAGAAPTVDGQRERCFADLAAAAGVDPGVGRAVARAYAEDRDHRDVVCLDGATETLQALAGAHRLGIVTNGAPDMQTQKLEALGIGSLFDVIVHAGYDGPAKPAPEPFRDALDTLGVTPDRSVHVGNSLEADVAGAKAAGLTAVWLGSDDTPEPTPRPDHVIATLGELADPPWG